MTVIRYSAGKLVGLALGLGAVAAFWLWMLIAPDEFMDVHGRYGFLLHLIAEHAWLSGGLFALFFGLVALILGTVIGDRTALALRPDGVELRTLYSRYSAGWAQVARIGIEKAGRLAGGGETLTVRLRQELGEKVVRLSTGLLEQSRWEIDRLLEAAGRPGVGTGAELRPEGEAPAAMDYDAVIARHLAARQSGTQSPAPSFPRPSAGVGFGRKGL